jgi:hypothetical protein
MRSSGSSGVRGIGQVGTSRRLQKESFITLIDFNIVQSPEIANLDVPKLSRSALSASCNRQTPAPTAALTVTSKIWSSE